MKDLSTLARVKQDTFSRKRRKRGACAMKVCDRIKFLIIRKESESL